MSLDFSVLLQNSSFVHTAGEQPPSLLASSPPPFPSLPQQPSLYTAPRGEFPECMAVQVTLGHFSALPPPPLPALWSCLLHLRRAGTLHCWQGESLRLCEEFDEKAISKGHPASRQQGTMWEESQLRCESCPGLTSTVDMERAWWHETE